jgi:lysophospholipase L1-like esterase
MTASAVAATGALALAAATVMAKPASPPTAIVSLGDSFISGEGGGSYGASAKNGCHRSAMAPIRSAPIDVDLKINLACSGAKAVNIWRAVSGGKSHRGERPQADQLAAVARRYDVRMVVLAAGANDLGFSAIVAGCALDWARSHPGDPRYCHGDAQRKIESKLPVAARGLRKAIREIRAAMATAGHRPGDYRLLVMGYASPFPLGPRFRYPESGWSRLTRGGCPVWNADADWARRWALPAIASTMRSAAAAEGAEYLDVRRALAGHEVCARGVSEFDHHIGGSNSLTPLESRSHTLREWFRPLRLTGRVRESLHPNPLGQRVIGRCLAQAYAEPIPAHRCKS